MIYALVLSLAGNVFLLFGVYGAAMDLQKKRREITALELRVSKLERPAGYMPELELERFRRAPYGIDGRRR